MTDPLLVVRHLTKHFPAPVPWWAGAGRGVVHAVDDVSLAVRRGETVALVGESGCGKSTLGRCILRLVEPTAGEIMYRGEDITHASRGRLRELRRHVQMIFQDPNASLNPRMTVGGILREPLDIYGEGTRTQRQRRAVELLVRVGLPPHAAHAFPHELSGGQRQRVGIAAALALEPELIIADEPISSLDLSVQAQILNLLVHLQREYGLAFIFISHDLGVVRHLSDRVAVMYLGRIVEEAPTADLFTNPRHPYTQALLAAIPQPDPRQRAEPVPLSGEVPSPIHPPVGCRFHPRCPFAMPVCREREPPFYPAGDEHQAACFLLDARYAGQPPVAAH